ncbi:MAG: FAD-binding protein [Acidimicrobiia bacterium]|nr:FAD-binding protein [Acidimicrobiia bacterium]
MEMLILGVGIAGACAAVEAHDLGVEVLAIDKAGAIRGTCSVSGGALCGAGSSHQELLGIEDDVEVMIADIMRCGDQLGDPEVIRAFAELSGETIDWLQDLGCNLLPFVKHEEGIHTIDRTVFSHPEGDGLGWMLGLEKAINQRGIEVELETAVTRLYREPNGRVVGAEVETKDGTTRSYKATKGVLLAVGGLGNNNRLWEQYSPVMRDIFKKAKKVRGVYPPAAQGDGRRIAADVGAYLYPEPATHGGNLVEVTPDEGAPGLSILVFRWAGVGAISLNANGERFEDETSFLDSYVHRQFASQPGLWHLLVFDDDVRQTKEGQLYAQPAIDLVRASGHDTVQRADTIEELAEKFGIPPAAARTTVDDWNSLVAAGGPDPLTGRTIMGAKIENPPFWGIEQAVAIGLSKGGVRITPKAEVQDGNYDVIPGLFAAGEMAYFQVHGSGRVHVAGGCNATGANFGRIAARSIAREDARV